MVGKEVVVQKTLLCQPAPLQAYAVIQENRRGWSPWSHLISLIRLRQG
jgi:hypothetical protein